MSKLRLPGSSLLDRCIGRSTFQYTQAIKIPSFEHNLNYDSFIKTLSKYEPSKYRHIWYYSTPFGTKKFLFFSMFSANKYNTNTIQNMTKMIKQRQSKYMPFKSRFIEKDSLFTS